ncbi:MAG: glycosyltransferase family A protein [Leptolinea sp.]
MISIFTAPKPFTNPHIAIIQHNAIRSWQAIGAEVILVGDDEGVAEAAQKLGVQHAPDVVRNQSGTPRIDSIFDLGRKSSTGEILACINTDVILLPDFNMAVERVQQTQKEFLIIGQRWDLDLRIELDFSDGWENRLQQQMKTQGRRHPRGGSDYFIFPKTVFNFIPPFAIGRAGWDNWMIYEARQQGWKVVDGSTDVNIIHQDHDYSHLPGGKPHYRLPESFENIKVAGGKRSIFTLDDCDLALKDGQLDYFPINWKKFWREVEIIPLVRWHSQPLANLFYAIFHPVMAYRDWRGRGKSSQAG